MQVMEETKATRLSGDEFDIASYKALSSPAVISFALGVLSLLTFISAFFAPVPFVGAILAWTGLRSIHLRPHELTGKTFGRVGMFLCLLSLLGGLGYRSVLYATEVSPGYQRVSYAELQPADPTQRVLRLPESAEALVGKQIFLRGFIYPDGRNRGLKQFVLCRDKGDCCFGGNPKPTDRVLVRIKSPEKAIDFTTREVAVEGTFRIEEQIASGGMGGAVYYHIDADLVKR